MIEIAVWYWAVSSTITFLAVVVYDRHFGQPTGWQGSVVYAILSACMGIVMVPIAVVLVIASMWVYITTIKTRNWKF